VRILIAPDKFKGSLTARAAAEAMRRGLAAVFPAAEFDLVPVADGGEGTAEIFHSVLGGEWITRDATGPMGGLVPASYVWLGDRGMAVIEMAAASGYMLVPPERRDPLRATTRGTGELIRDAIRRGARHIVVGLGSSATNDAGAGMAAALGWEFRDAAGREVEPVPENFPALASVVRPPSFPTVTIDALCDVTNPLTGPDGASRVYGPQKGATPEMVEVLDRSLDRLADLCAAATGSDHRATPGAGAAGGMGFGMITFCGAELKRGFRTVAELIGFEERVALANLVVTGEGCIDAQSRHGKAPAEIAALARRHGVPVIALAGAIDGDAGMFDGEISLCDAPMSLDHARARAAELLERAARRAGNFLRISL
jgi:glycerate kinase